MGKGGGGGGGGGLANGGGDIAVSLGTSDVLITSTSEPVPGLEGHVFVHPTECGDEKEGSYMGRCFSLISSLV